MKPSKLYEAATGIDSQVAEVRQEIKEAELAQHGLAVAELLDVYKQHEAGVTKYKEMLAGICGVLTTTYCGECGEKTSSSKCIRLGGAMFFDGLGDCESVLMVTAHSSREFVEHSDSTQHPKGGGPVSRYVLSVSLVPREGNDGAARQIVDELPEQEELRQKAISHCDYPAESLGLLDIQHLNFREARRSGRLVVKADNDFGPWICMAADKLIESLEE